MDWRLPVGRYDLRSCFSLFRATNSNVPIRDSTGQNPVRILYCDHPAATADYRFRFNLSTNCERTFDKSKADRPPGPPQLPKEATLAFPKTGPFPTVRSQY